jgi:hypothetical protein
MLIKAGKEWLYDNGLNEELFRNQDGDGRSRPNARTAACCDSSLGRGNMSTQSSATNMHGGNSEVQQEGIVQQRLSLAASAQRLSVEPLRLFCQAG